MSLFNYDLPPGLEASLSAMEKEFLLMRSSGSSIREIARSLKKSPSTICEWNKKFADEIIRIRNAEFCDLQKKVIDSKTIRLNFLKSEFQRASSLLKKQKMDVDDIFGKYNKYLELYTKLSELMSSCETDILTVGVKFKDNIAPETSLSEMNNHQNFDESNNPVTNSNANCNTNETIDVEKAIDNSTLKNDEKQNGTNRNTQTPKKFEAYKKHRLR